MIDQDLIDTSTESAKIAIANCHTTPSDGLYLINSVFGDNAIVKLKEYINNANNQKFRLAQSNATNQDKIDTSESRVVITWDPDTIIEELHEVCNNLTDTISKKFFNAGLNYLGIQIWKDTNKFWMGWHRDNPDINVSMQVYMFNTPSKYGTSFLIDGNEFAVPYQHNTGYIAINNNAGGIADGLEHKPTKDIPAGITRCSVYAVWSLSEKIIEEEATC